MWQTDISKQYLDWDGRRWSAQDVMELCRLADSEKAEAARDLFAFLRDWFQPSPEMEVQTSGTTGVPKRMRVRKDRMMSSACQTCEFLGLHSGDSALLCMNLKYIGAKMMVVRALVAGLHVVLRPPSGTPLRDVEEPIDFLSVVPMQLYNCLQDTVSAERLSHIRVVIVGGGAVDENLRKRLDAFPGKFYSTYGMTETLSHVAMRRLNGTEAAERYYPLEQVRMSLSAENTLVVHAPALCDTALQTNDMARLYADGSFVLLGRKDNTVNSGGIKIQLEEDERTLAGKLKVPFVLTAVPDERLGEALVLLIQGRQPTGSLDEFRQKLAEWLPRYHAPRYICSIAEIPVTETGKVNRKACKELARALLKETRDT